LLKTSVSGRDAPRALLFDLDGTLINVDLERFLKEYAKLLAEAYAPRVPRELFGPAFMAGVTEMLEGRPDRSNAQRFFDTFCQRVGIDEAWTREQAEWFYTEKYPSLRPLVEPIPAAPEVVAEARARGWLVVVATQPLFPRTAIVQRMEWGGLDPEAFDYITHMEAFHACKPSSHFFEELCQTIDVPPSRCVMVGNDVHDDMPAANVGIASFLAKDFLLRADHPAPPPRAEGSLADLLRLIQTGELERWIA